MLDFHTGYLRIIEVKDLARRRAALWQTGVAKSDFESFRKRMVEDEKAKMPGAGVDDEPLYDLDDDQGGDGSVADGPPPEGAGERNLSRQLAALRRDVSREPLQRKKPQLPKAKVNRDAKAKVDERKKDSRSRSKKRSRGRSKDRKPPLWFGRRRSNPKGHESDEESKASRGRQRRRKERRTPSRSPSGRASKKARKEKDRGPFGVGREMAFEKEEGDLSQSESGEEGFQRGASDRRSHQLKLVEYSDTHIHVVFRASLTTMSMHHLVMNVLNLGLCPLAPEKNTDIFQVWIPPNSTEMEGLACCWYHYWQLGARKHITVVSFLYAPCGPACRGITGLTTASLSTLCAL